MSDDDVMAYWFLKKAGRTSEQAIAWVVARGGERCGYVSSIDDLACTLPQHHGHSHLIDSDDLGV